MMCLSCCRPQRGADYEVERNVEVIGCNNKGLIVHQYNNGGEGRKPLGEGVWQKASEVV